MILSPFLKKLGAFSIAVMLVVPGFFSAIQAQRALAIPVVVVGSVPVEKGPISLVDQFIATAEDIIIDVETTISAVKTTYLALKEAVLDPIAKLLGNQLASMLVNQMFSFIGKGNNGAPSFVTNPQAYFGSVAQESNQVFLSDLQNNTPQMLPSIRNAVSQRITQENYVDAQRMTQSTFPGGDAGYQAYLQHPGTCPTGNSWDCYFATLEPQNNPYDVYQLESQKLAAKRSTDVKLSQDEIAWGNGYHSLKDCIERDVPSASAGDDTGTPGSPDFVGPSQPGTPGAADFVGPSNSSASAGDGTGTPGSPDFVGPSQPGTPGAADFVGPSNSSASTGNCTEYLTKTPGDALAGQVQAYLDAPMKIIENVHEIQELGGVVISGIQSFMNGEGLTSVNEAGTQGTNQGNGVTTYPYKP